MDTKAYIRYFVQILTALKGLGRDSNLSPSDSKACVHALWLETVSAGFSEETLTHAIYLLHTYGGPHTALGGGHTLGKREPLFPQSL